VVFTAVHSGHDLRDEIRERMVMDVDVRFREEDPFTDAIGAGVGSGMVMHRSRFEVDLNRPRETCVYQRPEDCWDLDVWREGTLPDEVAERSRQSHDAWFAELGRLNVLARRGPFVVFDLHSYNHRRDGAEADPAPGCGDGHGASAPTTASSSPAHGGADGVPDTHGTQLADHERGTTRSGPAADHPAPRRGVRRVDVAHTMSRRSLLEDSPGLSLADRAVDHQLGLLASTFRFLLDVAPMNVERARTRFLETGELMDFEYRRLEDDPDVLRQVLFDIPVQQVEDPVLGTLLRNKQRELALQIEMLQARDTPDFIPLSIELYGAITPALRETAEHILTTVPGPETDADDALDAKEFLELARREIEYYRDQDKGIEAHAEIRRDVSGVMVSGDTLMLSPESRVQRARASALLQHEVGTHLVTHVNGSAQPSASLATGLAGYDETQEGLAVLAEVVCGQLTAFRLRQLAARVATVHRMVSGADFEECHAQLLEEGITASSAFTTVLRAFRSGGMTKDAIYLRGLLDLVDHVRGGNTLDLFLLGKFSLADLPLVQDLESRRILRPPRIEAHWLTDPDNLANLQELSELTDSAQLVNG